MPNKMSNCFLEPALVFRSLVLSDQQSKTPVIGLLSRKIKNKSNNILTSDDFNI